MDTDETIGGTKVIQNGWISPHRQICLTIIGLLLSTVLIGWWLIGHSGQEWLWGPVVFAVLSAVFYVSAAHTLRVPGIRRAVRMPEYGIYHGYGLLCGNGERLFGAEPCPGASRGAHGGGDSLLSKPA